MGPLFALLRRKGSGERQGAGSNFWSRPRKSRDTSVPRAAKGTVHSDEVEKRVWQSLTQAPPSASTDLSSEATRALHPTFGAQQHCDCSLETGVKGADLCPSLPSAEQSSVQGLCSFLAKSHHYCINYLLPHIIKFAA